METLNLQVEFINIKVHINMKKNAVILLLIFSIFNCFSQEIDLIKNEEDVYSNLDYLPQLTNNTDTIYTELMDFVLTIKFNSKLNCTDLITSFDGSSASIANCSILASLYNVTILEKKSVSFNNDSIQDSILYKTQYLLVPENIIFEDGEVADVLVQKGYYNRYLTMVIPIYRNYLFMKRDKNYCGYSIIKLNKEEEELKNNIEYCIECN